MPKVLIKGRNRKLKIGLVLFVLVFFITVVFFYIKEQIKPLGIEGDSNNVTIEIPLGSTTEKIAEILEKNSLIRNRYIFRIIVKMKNVDGKLKAGEYSLNNKMDLYQIIDVLIKGSSKKTITFTIPEGYELSMIAEKLSKQNLVDKERFLELCNNVSLFKNKFDFLNELPEGLTLEGYLFPDTYEIYKDAKEEDIIDKMLARFEQVYNDKIKEKAKKLNLTMNEVITLASIIEREAKLDNERPLISAVFHNRLKKGWLLQSCATVQYVLGERKEKLTYADLKIDSRYNTYLYKGLPPGPIASPGLKSMEAAVEPADVDYLFFVANENGSHIFSKTFNEHIKAKNKYK
ncbi:endolytic transglycosylase MltG [Caloranaerobacter azorensis]|uniref:Endolytic murein transglycosylase n=1 Tax=Caloranaerobacter azorensis TaxID=116090 RepID=A0A6P1YCM7_9FIRM|nr:endolytic transglycosylase MltG [Caloranaerobacter azorensis]QIB26483.1 endolytic transglycosylase MltG [Caloranaerobacter azorensis]